MKILHLSTSLTGGAGIAARRLAEFQASQGHDVEVISVRNFLTNLSTPRKINKTIAGKTTTLINKAITSTENDSLSPRSINLLSMRDVLTREPSIVHLHNSYNLIDFPEFFKLGKYLPIVATLHDERIITGGCHITLGCTRFQESCANCPQARAFDFFVEKSQEKKKKALQALPAPLEAISPSHWLRHQVTDASWTKNLINVNVIPNMVANHERSPFSGNSRTTFQVVIVAASSSLNKGVSVAIEAIKLVAHARSDQYFELLIVGGNKKSSMTLAANLKIVEVGSKNSVEVEELMAGASLLLVASRSENSPNVIVEAQLQRLPVLATNVGGISEMVTEKETGFLCELSAVSIASRMSEIVEISDAEIDKLTTRAFDFALKRHNPMEIHQSILKIYAKTGAH